MVHDKLRPFSCTKCNLKLFTKIALDKHIQVSTYLGTIKIVLPIIVGNPNCQYISTYVSIYVSISGST